MAGSEHSSSKTLGLAERPLSGDRDGSFGHILLKNPFSDEKGAWSKEIDQSLP